MEDEKKYPEIYAVDFDGTLNLADKYPQLGKPNMELIEFLNKRQQDGDIIILWTCREGELLKSAIKFCMNYGLKFDVINDNTKENQEKFGNNCRKVFAHHYIDDRNASFGNIMMTELMDMVHCKDCKYWEKEIGWCDKHSHFVDKDGNECHPWESDEWERYFENDYCSYGEKR